MKHWHEEVRDLHQELNKNISHIRRKEIGDQLAYIGDGRKGIGIDEAEIPEIAWCLANWPSSESEIYSKKVIDVPKLGECEITVPFAIAKYPITYTQMRAFLQAEDGYVQDIWWDGLAVQKKFWEQNWKIANYPAENMNWYTAVAFCRWLSKKLGYEVRLPTEAEWWLAATLGERSRIYPWKGDWSSESTNSLDGGLYSTLAVGMYPSNSAACGALDMIGNVREWCLNEGEKPKVVNINSGEWKAVRGGSFMDSGQIDVETRGYFSPINQFTFIGFRIASLDPVGGF